MQVSPLGIDGAFTLTPRIHRDERGSFLEWYRHEALREALGHPLDLAQANCSTSRAGVIRGLHFADVPPGQAKYVTCLAGSILDVVVDLRVGSPGFGQVAVVPLDDESRRAVYLAEGLGHGFQVLSGSATVAYLCSTVYTPGAEHGITPLDPALDLPWSTAPDDPPADGLVSAKDLQAPTLAQALERGLLPTWQQCQERTAELRRAAAAGSAEPAAVSRD